MIRRALLLPALAAATFAVSAPAFADVATDGTDSTDGDDQEEEEDEEDEEDTGCAHVRAFANPATGLSLVVGVGLVIGLRRRD